MGRQSGHIRFKELGYMRITIAAIGKAATRSPEHALFQEYAKRLPWKLELREHELKKQLSSADRKIQETALLLESTKQAQRLVALDERGETPGSEEFARTLARWQQQGASHIGFVIGGSDGLDESARSKASLVLSFGRLTWPHMLARAMLAEQLYRAHTLMTGHPYHRS